MYTYTAVQLQSKTFGQLKSIARELDIVPTADRRCRQNWIDALVGVNPLLLQLLEVSPAGEEVEPVAPGAIAPAVKTKKRAQKPIAPTAENSPGVKTKKRAQKPIEVQATEPRAEVAKTSTGVEVDRVSGRDRTPVIG